MSNSCLSLRFTLRSMKIILWIFFLTSNIKQLLVEDIIGKLDFIFRDRLLCVRTSFHGFSSVSSCEKFFKSDSFIFSKSSSKYSLEF